ncbi:MAG: GNAT family N-acetyltransferase [Actinomycetota bacterium]|nr:GNAT family N-acetyltransferase [Actinomycetota bacterium]
MRFPFSVELLLRLPRHPDWKYELVDGEAWLSPRPRPLGFVRRTNVPVSGASTHAAGSCALEICRDRAAVVALIVDVWAHEDPYRSFDVDGRSADLRRDIDRSLLRPGSVDGAIATDADGPCACVLVTGSSPPALTWLTVRRDVRGRGVATALLRVVVGALAARGESVVTSHASAANLPSLRWHLARGFELTPDPVYTALRAQGCDR